MKFLTMKEDERAKKERYKINMRIFAITSAVALVSTIIKSSLQMKFSFFDYAAELITFGTCVIYAAVLLIMLLCYKRLDERLDSIRSKIGTGLLCAVLLSYLGMVVAMMIDIVTREPGTALLSTYSFIPFVSASTVIGAICRMLMARTISKTASNTNYKQYKKRVMLISLIVTLSCLASGIGLLIVSNFVESNIIMTLMLVCFLAIPISLLTSFMVLRAKRIYDKEAGVSESTNDNESSLN